MNNIINTQQIHCTKQMEDVRNSLFMKELLEKSKGYFIGGVVRDLFINSIFDKDIKPKDIDIVLTGISEHKLFEILDKHGDVKLVGESFGCFKFKPTGIELHEALDICLARTEVKKGKGHTGFEMTCDKNLTIEDDLSRRDFSINSIAIKIDDLTIIDPFNGIEDIKNKSIKCVNPSAFAHDSLRIIRGLQFSARFDFDIEEHTNKMMLDNIELLRMTNEDSLKGERIMSEIEKVWTKKGNLYKFIKEFRPYGRVIFDEKDDTDYTESIDVESLKMTMFTDFLHYVIKFSNTDTNKLINTLKPSSKVCKRLRLLDKIEVYWKPLIDNDIDVDMDEMFISIHDKESEVFYNSSIPKMLLKGYKEKLQFCIDNDICLCPKDLKEMKGIDGNTLMKQGFKGQEIKEEMFRLVKEDMKRFY